jgi:hypothetical protein
VRRRFVMIFAQISGLRGSRVMLIQFDGKCQVRGGGKNQERGLRASSRTDEEKKRKKRIETCVCACVELDRDR